MPYANNEMKREYDRIRAMEIAASPERLERRRASSRVYMQKKRGNGYKEDARDRRTYRLMKVYGLTPEQYNAMLMVQEFCCAICNRHDATELNRSLAVDHNHITGKVRGLLCDNCNLAIGILGDNANGLRRALVYLERDSGDSA